MDSSRSRSICRKRRETKGGKFVLPGMVRVFKVLNILIAQFRDTTENIEDVKTFYQNENLLRYFKSEAMTTFIIWLYESNKIISGCRHRIRISGNEHKERSVFYTSFGIEVVSECLVPFIIQISSSQLTCSFILCLLQVGDKFYTKLGLLFCYKDFLRWHFKW